MSIELLTERAGVSQLFDYQVEVLQAEADTPADKLRACLYYKTGAGKTITSLLMLAQAGCDSTMVVAPPSTHPAWIQQGERMGIAVIPISHAKFRMRDFRINRDMPLIADEFHMFGGHGKKGFSKLDRLAGGLRAPLILMSATPNYNDADRVYCIQHVLDPHSCKGGFIEFLYAHCNTSQNPYGMTPLIDEDQPFKNFKTASEYLAALPHVYYVEDDLVYSIEDITMPEENFPEMDAFGLNVRRGRIIASLIEEKHARIFNNLVDEKGFLKRRPMYVVNKVLKNRRGPVLIYCNHSTVAEALSSSLSLGLKSALVTGDTPKKKKAARVAAFNDGVLDVLIGTASLATGTDGMDKVCNTLLILDDTEDDSLRRQLIGRIMPRGADADASKKRVYRLLLTP